MCIQIYVYDGSLLIQFIRASLGTNSSRSRLRPGTKPVRVSQLPSFLPEFPAKHTYKSSEKEKEPRGYS